MPKATQVLAANNVRSSRRARAAECCSGGESSQPWKSVQANTRLLPSRVTAAKKTAGDGGVLMKQVVEPCHHKNILDIISIDAAWKNE